MGRTIHGRVRETNLNQANLTKDMKPTKSCPTFLKNYKELNDLVKQYFEIDSLGVSKFSKKHPFKTDVRLKF